MKLNRRGFLVGLFGAAVVAKAGPMPEALAKLSDTEFKSNIVSALTDFGFDQAEVYGNDKGEYAFATLTWTDKAPFALVSIPPGFRPLRAESDRIGCEAIARMLTENKTTCDER